MNKRLEQTRKNNITFLCEEQNLLPEELLAREAQKRAMLEGNEGLGGLVIADYVAQPAVEDGEAEGDGDGPLDVAVWAEQERQREEKERQVMEWWNESQKQLALQN